MKLCPVAPFFHSLLVWFWIYKTLQHVISSQQYKKHAAMFCKTKTKPKVSEKKGQPVRVSLGKEITTYRIGVYIL